jgi:hypothetical protein
VAGEFAWQGIPKGPSCDTADYPGSPNGWIVTDNDYPTYSATHLTETACEAYSDVAAFYGGTIVISPTTFAALQEVIE